MKQINIEAVPSQEFTVNIDGTRYDFTIKYISDGVAVYDIDIDEETILEGFRIVPGQMMIPYQYLETDGNFAFYVPDGDDIDYTEFGDSQLLYYLTADEAAEVWDYDYGD